MAKGTRDVRPSDEKYKKGPMSEKNWRGSFFGVVVTPLRGFRMGLQPQPVPVKEVFFGLDEGGGGGFKAPKLGGAPDGPTISPGASD